MVGDACQVLSVPSPILPEEEVDHGAVDVQAARFRWQIDSPALQLVSDQLDGVDGTAANLHLFAIAAGKHVIFVEHPVKFLGIF